MTNPLTMIERTSVEHWNVMRRVSEPLLRYFDISYFCYQFVSNEGLWYTLGNTPDWLQYSCGNAFYTVDPSLVNPQFVQSGVNYVNHHPHPEFQKLFVEHSLKLFNLDHCLAVVERDTTGCHYYFFGAPASHPSIMSIYMTQISPLRYDYTCYVQDELRTLLPKCLEHSVNLRELHPTWFDCKENALILGEDHKLGLDFLCEMKKLPILTARERDCLYLYQQGYTAKQTAHYLGLSFRTIEDYFVAIKDKFQVTEKNQLLRVRVD